MQDQDKKFFLIILSILINCLLENVWISLGEIPCESLLGVKELRIIHLFPLSILHPGCSSFFNTFHLLLIKLQALLPSSFPTIWVSVTTAPVHKEITWKKRVAREVTYTLKSISRITNLKGKITNLILTCLSVNFLCYGLILGIITHHF